MQDYDVVVMVNSKKTRVRIKGAESSTAAEQDARKQFPNCSIIDISRCHNDSSPFFQKGVKSNNTIGIW
jgi:hypothetical protein